MATYYRFHSSTAPKFSSGNAWSGLWGSIWSKDGSQTRCNTCDGTGVCTADPMRCRKCRGTGNTEDHGDCGDCGDCGGTGRCPHDTCPDCEGLGWLAAARGYSACASAEELAAYFGAAGRDMAFEDQDGQVLVFEGHQVGDGFDGEPLVVPTRVLESMTWGEFAAQC